MTVRMTSVLSGVVLVACIALTAHAVVPRVHPFARTRIPTSEAAVEARPAYSSCSKSGCDSGTSWDFLLFVNNWPQSVCDTTSRKCSVPSGVDYFTIHGLWPSNNDTSYPCCCNDNYFNPDNVTSIQQELEDYWTDMFPGDGDNFWEHEYSTLSCFISIFTATVSSPPPPTMPQIPPFPMWCRSPRDALHWTSMREMESIALTSSLFVCLGFLP
eukprot:TRINITY_DN523_c0_g1_i1.p1 TRINITY_DN523_c0_g1~~TRINITY_DN523_c0_g1_i1.p1  ORF type:complete len:214 (+),score=23.08 TRINITY_DN523_c0_g1_i1:128-769(+)